MLACCVWLVEKLVKSRLEANRCSVFIEIRTVRHQGAKDGGRKFWVVHEIVETKMRTKDSEMQ